ncbi:MAG: hypothetical protein KF824_05525 [Fimbriimonadaceae bacterium]|nr:MAG: hypothetical protein KF824_05525 [Fimbriimonadaceae bacterium]
MLVSLAILLGVQVQPIKIETLFQDYFSGDSTRVARAQSALSDYDWKPEYKSQIWKAYSQAPIHKQLKADFDARIVKTADRTAPFKFRIVGTPNGKSMPLVFALHGGGSGPASLNNSQWDGMFNGYYRDKPESGPYIYCALRAPNDEWNGFYDDSISPLVERLILAFTLFGNADPQRVSITGASHGGYGTFVIAPKIPYRFASANASASAPTDGETEGVNLRNLYFTWMIGGKDNAYGRPERCQKFSENVKEWRTEYGGFEGGMTFLSETGHSVPDRDILRELLSVRRNPAPDKLIWVQSDNTLKNHYWLTDPNPKSGRRIYAEMTSSSITVVNSDAPALEFRLNLASTTKSFVIVWGKTSTKIQLQPYPANYCESLMALGDPDYASPFKIVIENPNLSQLN